MSPPTATTTDNRATAFSSDTSHFLNVLLLCVGMKAVRNETNGSWFVEVLCDMLQRHHDQLDLVTILTRVNHKMAFDKEMQGNKLKQVSSFVSTLTKDLYLTSTS